MTQEELAAYTELLHNLTDERLALDLERLADNVSFYGTAQRRATLLEAARRLTRVPR
jgi:hypothetical protein